jgi:glutamyl-Q tRNA(Asp) synthetase
VTPVTAAGPPQGGDSPLGGQRPAQRRSAGAYIGRFAPSPTGPLHAGSLVAALASWLDARAHEGQWLVRIEDVDTPRCQPGAAEHILRQLATCGLVSDGPVGWQSRRGDTYQRALDELLARHAAYPCACSRKDIAAALAARGAGKPRHGELAYPGTCRPEHGGLHGQPARAWRFLIPSGQPPLRWHDRRLGEQAQDVAAEVGDFVLRRADGLWAYQLAVVVDDGAQGVTHVVRGADLADNTPRQVLLQQALGLPTPHYLHTPLVLAADGLKLSKQNGAAPLDLSEPLAALNTAAAALGLAPAQGTVPGALAAWTHAWAEAWARPA